MKFIKLLLIATGLYWMLGAAIPVANAEMQHAPVSTPGYYVEDLQRDRLVTAITRLYKRISHSEAVRVVDLAYYYANQHRVKPSLVLGIIGVESGFNRMAVSPDGSKGYMQVLPKYHKDKIAGRNIHNPQVNIEIGAQIFGDCVKHRKTVHQALACYNGAITPSKAAAYARKVTQKTELIEIISTI